MYRWINYYSAVLRISGADANSWVQGQFSNDVEGTGPLATYGFWLDHKGKVQADSFVLRVGPAEFLAASYFSEAAAVRAQLEKFIIADDVTLTDETRDWVGLGAWGGTARAVAEEVGFPWPVAGEFVHAGPARVFVGRRSAQENFEVLIRPADVPARWKADVTTVDLERERIGGNIPAVPLDLGPSDLPNEGGLEDIAISYTKGCFTGQEVMARLKNLGQVRRRLMVVRGDGAPPGPGTTLFQRGRKVGEIRSAVADGEGFLAFAMMSLLGLDPAAGLARSAEAPESIRFVAHG